MHTCMLLLDVQFLHRETSKSFEQFITVTLELIRTFIFVRCLKQHSLNTNRNTFLTIGESQLRDILYVLRLGNHWLSFHCRELNPTLSGGGRVS